MCVILKHPQQYLSLIDCNARKFDGNYFKTTYIPMPFDKKIIFAQENACIILGGLLVAQVSSVGSCLTKKTDTQYDMSVFIIFGIIAGFLVSAGELRRPGGLTASSAVLFRRFFVIADAFNIADDAFFFAHLFETFNHLFD